MATAKYINFNQGLPIGEDSTSIFSRIKSAGSNLNSTTLIIIVAVILFAIIAGFYYYYYILPGMQSKYKPNNEKILNDNGSGNTAELLFFYANWCPHCKTAKPIWHELKNEYQNKTINGYIVIFTEIDCSEETAEVDKMMNQYGVEGYPTIKLLKDGQVIEYDAKPTKETLTQFLNTVL
jgi:thiol-disulfide isomerase/thioredoxin